MPARVNKEHDIQASLVHYCQVKALSDSRYGMLFSIPNGAWLAGGVSQRMGLVRKLKREGLRNGVPDLFLAYPTPVSSGLFLECKAGNNQQTDEQRKWQERLETAGYCYRVFRSLDEGIEMVTRHLAANLQTPRLSQ